MPDAPDFDQRQRSELIDWVLGLDHNYALGLKSRDFPSTEELNEIPLEDW